MFKTNESLIDRLARGLLASVFLILAIFWSGGAWQWVFYIIAAAMACTAISGLCLLYRPFGIDTNKSAKSSKMFAWILVLLVITVLSGGTYASNFFSKKFFLEDFNVMNNFYKQTLFYTGQEKRAESIANYDQLISAYTEFKEKYEAYQPLALRGDEAFVVDLDRVELIIKDVETGVREGNLKDMHVKLEAVRPIWQEIFKRNGFSMLAVTLVDFHDSMEKVLEPANEGDAAAVIAAYAEADQKLAAVEAEANDDEIKAIRTELNKILDMAKSGANKEDLAKQSAILKASFVKVYLKRG